METIHENPIHQIALEMCTSHLNCRYRYSSSSHEKWLENRFSMFYNYAILTNITNPNIGLSLLKGFVITLLEDIFNQEYRLPDIHKHVLENNVNTYSEFLDYYYQLLKPSLLEENIQPSIIEEEIVQLVNEPESDSTLNSITLDSLVDVNNNNTSLDSQ